MFNPGSDFGLGAVFRPLDLIDNTAVAVAAVGEIPGLRRMLPDYRPLAAVGLIAPHAGLFAVQQLGQHSIPIRLICSTDGLLCLRSNSDLILARLLPSGAVHTNKWPRSRCHGK